MPSFVTPCRKATLKSSPPDTSSTCRPRRSWHARSSERERSSRGESDWEKALSEGEPGMPDRELMDAQAEALFVHDEDGRIVRTNEPGGTSAPRFFLGRTCDGNVWRLRNDLPDRLARELVAAASKEPVATELWNAPVH